MSSKILTLMKPQSVGIWVRVSTEMQAQGDSPMHHEQRARDYAASKGWTVAKTYSLEAVSGKAVLWHPETQRMLADIKSGEITTLIVSKFARLVRNTRELLEVSDIFHEHRADLVSLDEPINVATSSGRLFLSVLGALAQWEREEIGSRVAASIPIRAKLGKCVGGSGTFGHHWVDGKLVIHPDEAPIRKLVYELFIKHKRKKTVARLLNEAGHRTRNGSKFSDTTIARLIRDPSAKGLRRANHTRSEDNGKAWVAKPESDWVMVPIEPIVTEDVWDEANRIIDAQLAERKRPGKMSAHVFSGIAQCGCGGKMYVYSDRSRYVCCKCRTRIRVDDLENLFVEGIRAMYAEDRLVPLFERVHEELRIKSTALAESTGILETLRSETTKCYEAYVAGNLDQEDFGRRYRPLKDRVRVCEAKIGVLQDEVETLGRQHKPGARAIIGDAKSVTDKWWPLASKDERRWLAENLAQRIVVEPTVVTVEFGRMNLTLPDHRPEFGVLSLLYGTSITLGRSDSSRGSRSSIDGRRGSAPFLKVLVA